MTQKELFHHYINQTRAKFKAAAIIEIFISVVVVALLFFLIINATNPLVNDLVIQHRIFYYLGFIWLPILLILSLKLIFLIWVIGLIFKANNIATANQITLEKSPIIACITAFFLPFIVYFGWYKTFKLKQKYSVASEK